MKGTIKNVYLKYILEKVYKGMKIKRSFLLTILLWFVFSINVFAAEQENTVTTEKYLILDDANVYGGMSSAYKDGYIPSVYESSVEVILPLRDLSGGIESITAKVEFYDETNTLFVFKNYQKTFVKSNEKINGTDEEQEVFLLQFNLELCQERYNGVYPVKIIVSSENRQLKEQTFNVYVRITDGIAPAKGEEENQDKIEESITAADVTVSESTEIPTSEPKVIISKCTGASETVMICITKLLQKKMSKIFIVLL